MKEIDNIILDLDGTVYVDNKIINKSDIEIRRLAKKGKSIYYLTNNTSKNTKHYISKLNNLNLPVSTNSIISPIHVMIDWIKKNNIKCVYILGVQELIDELEEKTGVVNSSKNPELIIVAFDKELLIKSLKQLVN